MNSMDDGSSLGHYTNYVNGVASITFTLSRSSVIGGSGVLWVAFHDGSPDPYGHIALQPYGVADWFNHFVHIVPLFFYRFIWSRSHTHDSPSSLGEHLPDGTINPNRGAYNYYLGVAVCLNSFYGRGV